MLRELSISNYALVEQLKVDFNQGFCVITGETGAGKSILLGALKLVMGQRADVTHLKDKHKKCVIEATFEIENYNLQNDFQQNDLDYEPTTIIRREILASGKSRAFVNDTPVNLKILQDLKKHLVDIHSQHQTVNVMDIDYQYYILDVLAGQEESLQEYRDTLNNYKDLQRQKNRLSLQQQESLQQQDYNKHLYEELLKADLKQGEQQQIEQKLATLNNGELITNTLLENVAMLTAEQTGLQSLLYQLQNNLGKIANFSKEYTEIFQRICHVKTELDDLTFELEKLSDNTFFDIEELAELNDRLSLILNLQAKHNVRTIEELLDLQQSLFEKIDKQNHLKEDLEQTIKQLSILEKNLQQSALKLFENRKKQIPIFIEKSKKILTHLGMQQADFKINIKQMQEFNVYGKDQITFLFLANKGASYESLKKVASGGELSRIMLAVKYILSKHAQLPTIIFDEIDTGISGEISNKIGNIMQSMAEQMQVITISHLPQVAAKGNNHYKVYKEEVSGITTSFLKRLNKEQRIVEIAQMLGGANYSASAIEHAKSLLKI